MPPPIPISLSTLLCTQAKFSTELHEPKGGIYAKTMQHICELNFENGDVYKGEVEDGYMHGQGEYCFHDGTTYTGGFRYNLPTGQGKLTVPSSQVNRFYTEYSGQFLHGVRSGLGVLRIPQEGFEYTGEFSSGIMQGKAKVLYHNGSTYEGQVYKGKRHGFGRLTYKSGNYYEGHWSDGIKQGFGKMVWMNLQEEYAGEWKENKCHGWGTLYYYQQNRRIALLTNRFVGTFSMGARNGIGTFFYADGSKYEGEWVENQKHGYAIHTLEDGSVNEGYYERDRLVLNFRTVLSDVDSLLYNPATVPGLAEDPFLAQKFQMSKNPNAVKDLQFQSNGKPYSLVGYSQASPPTNQADKKSPSPNPDLNRTKNTVAPGKNIKPKQIGSNTTSPKSKVPVEKSKEKKLESMTQGKDLNKESIKNLKQNQSESGSVHPQEAAVKSTRLIVSKDQGAAGSQVANPLAVNMNTSSSATLPPYQVSKRNMNSQNSLNQLPKLQPPTSPPAPTGPTVVQQNIYISLIKI